MIEYVSRSGPPEAMNCPAFVCDACREQITDMGNAEWAVKFVDGGYTSSPLFTTHKKHSHAFRKLFMEKAYPFDDGWSYMWNDIDEFMKHLAYNMSHPFADDPEGQYGIPKIVTPRRTI